MCLLYWDAFLAILEAFILKNFRESMPPDPIRTLAPAARAKNTLGILFSPPNRKNAARSLRLTSSLCISNTHLTDDVKFVLTTLASLA